MVCQITSDTYNTNTVDKRSLNQTLCVRFVWKKIFEKGKRKKNETIFCINSFPDDSVSHRNLHLSYKTRGSRSSPADY